MEMLQSFFFSIFLFIPFGNPSNSLSKKMENQHPFYVSVTEIEQNSKDGIIEISCRIFTDDFENTLRTFQNKKVDLLNPSDRNAANQMIEAYIKKHLGININGKLQNLQFVGYEKNEEAVECYFQINWKEQIKTVDIFNNLLFEYKSEQINIIHVIVNGKRQSTQLANPNSKANFTFKS